MARVPITVMGYRCERCGHEWIPRGNVDEEPKMCPACKSVRWNSPRKTEMTYEAFSQAVSKVLQEAGGQLTWTEVRTAAKLPQAFPNNKWVRRMESDIGLRRKRDPHGIIHWSLGKDSDLFGSSSKAAETPVKKGERARRKQSSVE
jgi:DNA-directed RNA polymerase subunit RPC12/RpoP